MSARRNLFGEPQAGPSFELQPGPSGSGSSRMPSDDGSSSPDGDSAVSRVVALPAPQQGETSLAEILSPILDDNLCTQMAKIIAKGQWTKEG